MATALRNPLRAEAAGSFDDPWTGLLTGVDGLAVDGLRHDPLAATACGCAGCTMPPPDLSPPDVPGGLASAPTMSPDVPIDAALLSQVSFLTGVKTDGTLTTGASSSYWGYTGRTAHKWGDTTAGSSGGNVTYYFDTASNFTATEKATFVKSFALWSAVADVTFSEVGAGAGAVKLQRGGPGTGAYASVDFTAGSGATIGHNNTALINISTSTFGFDLGGNPNTPVGGYGLSTVIHEFGHLLGLGHGGYYNGSVNASTQQFSQFDERMWTVMSYIHYGTSSPKFGGSYPVTGTNWGVTSDGYLRQAPHTWMPLDIMAIQQLYGEATGGPLSGGQVFGFNTNITGPLKDFFDFSYNQKPVVTLYNSGLNNTLDLSGYSAAATMDLRDGHYSSFNGMTNNLAIAFGTVIETGIGGAGNDTIQGNASNNVLVGGLGNDLIDGAAGRDVAVYAVASTAATWTKTASGYTVTASGLGTDTLTNVEVLRFTDRDVSLSITHPEVWRFYNTGAGGHFFTTDLAERDTVIASLPQFRFEGVGYYAADAAEAGSAPVWRFYNTGAGGHFFTTSIAERDTVIASLPQFRFEGVGYYAATTGQSDFQEVWRFYNTQAGGHFFTTSLAERDTVIASLPQFRFEGVGYYVPRNGTAEGEPDGAGLAAPEATFAGLQPGTQEAFSIW